MHDMRQIACPMCGRLVTVSGSEPVPCPSCGVPVSAPATELPANPVVADDDSATRVATIPPSEPAPAEAPPVVEAPAPVVAPLATSDGTDSRTQPVAAAEMQPITQTYPGTPPQQPTTEVYQHAATQQPVTQPYSPAISPAPQQGQGMPKRNPALVITGVVVAVVLLLGIIGAAVVFANRAATRTVAQPTLTPAATATATVPAGFTQFTDVNKVFSLNYPSEWTKSATSGDFSLAVFSGAPAHIPGVFEVEYIKTTLDPKTLEEQFFKGLALTGKASNQQTEAAVAQAGETWQRESADVAMGQVTQHVVVLATNHGKYSVLIAYLTSKDTFVSTETQYFKPMLSSFQFGQ